MLHPKIHIMREYIFICICAVLIVIPTKSIAQKYNYSLNLDSAKDNSIVVTLLTPKILSSSVIFSFPKIIPGTYRVSDFGTFISELKAYDLKGNNLEVYKLNSNQWRIDRSNLVYKMTYKVEGIFDSKQKHPIFPMAATSIEKSDVVINGPGFFGYFERMTQVPFELSIIKPSDFYASTSLIPIKLNNVTDIFKGKNVHELYDKPIMYCVPDTASVRVGNCSVLFSVYSPQGIIHALDIAKGMEPILNAVKNYLGGKLPIEKYAFIYYFHKPSDNQSFSPGLGGALEHTTSSFYYLPEISTGSTPAIVNISTHEFFHIITPLTISSREIKYFNYDSADMSKHFWLYEGTTEYNAHYVQERYGLITRDDFLSRLSIKLTASQKNFNDTLPFTTLSKHSADIFNDQFVNVYLKGAMIACCLDIYLLKLSKGKYGLHNLTHDLALKYGREKAFEDEKLFDEIGKMTYPEINQFLDKYVAGSNRIPYEYFLNMAGIILTPKVEKEINTLGNISFEKDSSGLLIIGNSSKFNEFGKSMGYQKSDIIYSINDQLVTPSNVSNVSKQIQQGLREGDILKVSIGRKDANGIINPMTLVGKVFPVKVTEFNKLEISKFLTPEQLVIQNAWLTKEND